MKTTYPNNVCDTCEYTKFGLPTQQYIMLDTPHNEVKNFVIKKFDFSFCKVMFDGENFIIHGNEQSLCDMFYLNQ